MGGLRLAPKLCPDGKTLVVMMDGAKSIRKRNLETGEDMEVAKTGGYAGGHPFDVSPDGQQVVFQLDGAVKTVSLNGGEPRELFRDLAKAYRLSWTRDGRYIIASAGENIWRVPAQGGTPLKLDLSIPKLDCFALHPDNCRFTYSVDEGFKEELWVLENLLPRGKVAAK